VLFSCRWSTGTAWTESSDGAKFAVAIRSA
jgi:hypothetical protein